MVNRASSYFPKGGHTATETELKPEDQWSCKHWPDVVAL